jgi:hypothetical protein
MRKWALAGLAAGALVLAPETAHGATVIDTTAHWGGAVVTGVGVPNAATTGQVVTVPTTDTRIDRFSFYIGGTTPTTTLTFRGEIYAWNGTAAVGRNLWESAPRTVTFTTSLQPVTFETGGVQLVGGQRYVLFITASRDYARNANPSIVNVGFLYADAYPGGGLVSLNSGPDISAWTTVPWANFTPNPAADAAFIAAFSAPLPTSSKQCKSGLWRNFGVFKNRGDCVSFVSTGGRNPPAQP